MAIHTHYEGGRGRQRSITVDDGHPLPVAHPARGGEAPAEQPAAEQTGDQTGDQEQTA